MKLKSFCTAKGTINKTKRQSSEWEKIFANEATDKDLVSRVYKEFLQLRTTTTKKPHNFKMGKGLGKTFLQRIYTNGQKAFKKHS